MRLFERNRVGVIMHNEKNLQTKIEETLELVGLEDRVKEITRGLSAGWRQRLALGIALVHHPKLLFLDEPTSGVDPVARREFWELIYEAADKGTTIFVTTHYMDEAEYCDRISMMVDGKIKALDTPTGLKNQFGAKDMDQVFLALARSATRNAD